MKGKSAPNRRSPATAFHGTVRGMNKRALLYAGFLTAAVALLLAWGRGHHPGAETPTSDTVATK